VQGKEGNQKKWCNKKNMGEGLRQLARVRGRWEGQTRTTDIEHDRLRRTVRSEGTGLGQGALAKKRDGMGCKNRKVGGDKTVLKWRKHSVDRNSERGDTRKKKETKKVGGGE